MTWGLQSPAGWSGSADVVYENFRPGVMERLGLGYDDCAAINPSIVYASASGYGPDGPYADRRGQDILAQAIGGLATMNAPAGGRPLSIGVPIADVLGGMNGAMAVMAALLYCNRTGEGQHIFVNLLDSVLAAQSEEALLFLNTPAGEPAADGPRLRRIRTSLRRMASMPPATATSPSPAVSSFRSSQPFSASPICVVIRASRPRKVATGTVRNSIVWSRTPWPPAPRPSGWS